MGEKKVISEEEKKDMVLPVANDVLDKALKLFGVPVCQWDSQSDKRSDVNWCYTWLQADWLRRNRCLTVS